MKIRGLFRDTENSLVINPQMIAMLPLCMISSLRFATVKFGAGVIQISGSIAGVTHARNRFSNYIRPRTKPVNPNSDRQSAVRTLMKMLTAYWSSAAMTDAERGAWATYAAAVSAKNRLGETIYLTGFNHFLRSNIARMIISGAIIEPGPTVLSLPGADETFVVTGSSGSQLLTLAFDDTQDWCKETGGYLSISMGQPQLLTRNFFNGPFRNAGAIPGNTAAPVTSPQTMTAPFTLVTDQKVWVNARLIRADARCSNPFFAPALIVDGLLNTYSVTGTLVPDATCNYDVTGAFNGKAYYTRRIAGFFIWWDGTDSWYISAVLGTPGVGFWKRTDPNIVGAYTLGGTATGDATVAGGEHP